MFLNIGTFNSLTDSHTKREEPREQDREANFQFPNGFSLKNKREPREQDRKAFQFPNGFSQRYYCGMGVCHVLYLSIP